MENRLEVCAADFGSLDAVRSLGAQLAARPKSLDAIVHKAGIFARARTTTVDGLASTFAVNHLAPFALTLMALPALAQNARLVFVSSIAHQRASLDLDDLELERPGAFEGYLAYANSKLCNLLTAFHLARLLAPRGITVNGLHPGVISTKLLRAGFSLEGDSLDSGARTPVLLAGDPSVAGVTGKYFVDEKEARPSAASRDEATQAALYQRSLELARVSPV